MNIRYIGIIIFISFVAVFSTTKALAQKKEKLDKKMIIESTVVDENGNPIEGAIVFGDEGLVQSKTDAAGFFKISISNQSSLLIESDGYEPVSFTSIESKSKKKFLLKSSPLNYGSKDDVYIAFGKVKKGNLVNSVSVINPEEILKYDNIENVAEALVGRVPGLMGNNNLRGLGGFLYIVDGLPRDISTINLNEVEQISVLKDANSSILYGNQAINGIIQITTKRGHANKKDFKVSGYSGIAVPVALPKYLNSADYMELNNEARRNDGLLPTYDSTQISNYRTGNPYRYPSLDYYSSDYLKSFKTFYNVKTELSGGTESLRYYSHVNWIRTGNLSNFGEDKEGTNDKFNVRGNIDLKVNNWINTSLDAAAVFVSDKGAVGDYWGTASTQKPNLFSPLLPINLIDPDLALLKARKNDVDGLYLLGGSAQTLTNPIANGYSGGSNNNIQRTLSFNNRIDFDLKKITEGLAFHTNVSFDFFGSYTQAINNSYSVYSPTWDALSDTITGLTQNGTDARTGDQNLSNQTFQRRFGYYGMLDYDRTFGDQHITASLLGYGTTYIVEGDVQASKNANLGMRIGYGYKNKFLVDFSSAFVNSIKLPEGNRTAFSPSLGLAWVVSSEKFMSSASFINYLKFRVTGGITNSENGIGGYYFYDNSYAAGTKYNWYEATWGNASYVSVHGRNPQLGFEKRKEINIGFEGLFFNKVLGLDANVFSSRYEDQINLSSTKYASYFNQFRSYENLDTYGNKGAELGLSVNKTFGDFSVFLGANALYTVSKVIDIDELHLYDYQYRTGRSADVLYGLVADGLFMDQAEIDGHANQQFGTVKPGDIKYVDQNGDMIINADDEIAIGRSQSPFSYGLNLKLSYKNFTLFARGNGRVGADNYIGGENVQGNNYYWVDGNEKYSEYVLNRWTEETKSTATYPRLSSIANNNNFQNSTYWLYRDNYFTLSRVQLTYDLPETVTKSLGTKNLSFYISGSNLRMFSKQRDVKEMVVGSEPGTRSYLLGVKILF